nr:ribonuclease H-like domain-containing protein [Tanacetum cinerariifolium]
MAIPEDHLAKFHKITDAKEMWEAIKSRFGRNAESKKMQKYIIKQQLEGFSVSNSEGLHKGYNKFQSLLSQLEIHGAVVSTKDANQKFLSTNSTNEVSTAYGVSTFSGHNSQKEGSSLYTDDLMYYFFANQSISLPMTEIYMPPKFDFGIDESKFTYDPKKSKTSKSDAKPNNLNSCESSSSVETLEFVPKLVESKPKVITKPKVWSDAPIIKVYELDSDDEYVFKAGTRKS